MATGTGPTSPSGVTELISLGDTINGFVKKGPGCPPCDPHDMNCDGEVNGRDIQFLVGLILGGENGCGCCTGDINGDSVVDETDVDLFVASTLSTGSSRRGWRD